MRRMIAYIADAENKIGSKLMLNFETPVLHHAGTTIAGSGEGWTASEISKEESGILRIAGERKVGEAGVQRAFATHKDGIKVVRGREIWICSGSTAKGIAKVGVKEGSMVYAVAAPKHNIVPQTINEAKTRRKVIHAVTQSVIREPFVPGEEQSCRRVGEDRGVHSRDQIGDMPCFFGGCKPARARWS